MLQSIHIKLLPSKLMLGVLSSVSIVCCAIVLTLPILLYVKFVIIALILVSSAYFILRDALLRLPNSWQTIDVDSKGVLIMTNRNGQKFPLKPVPSSFIHAGCSVLNFKSNNIKQLGFNFSFPPVILLPSAESTDELRRLRVWLRWFKQEENQDDLSVDLSA